VLFKNNKKIASFEKNPEKNRKPIMERNENKNEKVKKKFIFKTDKNNRLSWLWNLARIIYPTLINNNALNIAWVTKWKKANLGPATQNEKIIKPNCLSVDNATTFLKSVSKAALAPAIIKVNNLIIIIIVIICLFKRKFEENRITIKTPAVTNVEEWTNAEIGVGAAIAAGSHLLKGNWALFVKNPIIIKNKISNGNE